MKHIKWLLVLVAFLSVVPLVSQAQVYSTNKVVLAWDASPSQDITNYVVYYGPASRAYTNHVDAGINLTATVATLVNGGTYFFAATAKDKWGLESDFSNEVTFTVPRVKPVPPGQLRKVSP